MDTITAAIHTTAVQLITNAPGLLAVVLFVLFVRYAASRLGRS